MGTLDVPVGCMKKQTADAVAAMPEDEGDRICRMALQVMEHLMAIPTRPRPALEPTGAAYSPAVAPWVEQRSDERRR